MTAVVATQPGSEDGMPLFDVEGVLFAQPFKIRRLGHLGLYVEDVDAGIDFYTKELGLSVTDAVSMLDMLPPPIRHLAEGVTDPRMIFTTYGTDHHALLLMHQSISTMDPPGRSPEITTNQITFQVGSLAEVVNGANFLEEMGISLIRVGRDMPGSNWHVYFLDPDGFILELYYGMEQIGWSRMSKPAAMHYRGAMGPPPLPQMSEWDEVTEAIAREVDLNSGHQGGREESSHFNVGGIMLPRPFKVTKIGPVGLFVADVGRSLEFYTRLLGMTSSETVVISGHRCEFLRHGNEHHTLALYPLEAREALGLSSHSRVASLGFEVASYAQLRSAVAYFTERGATMIDLPTEFHTGIDYAAHLLDPDGHCIELYYYMEQIGWDGRTRPAGERRVVASPWPSSLGALSDTYVDQTFQGPLG